MGSLIEPFSADNLKYLLSNLDELDDLSLQQSICKYYL